MAAGAACAVLVFASTASAATRSGTGEAVSASAHARAAAGPRDDRANGGERGERGVPDRGPKGPPGERGRGPDRQPGSNDAPDPQTDPDEQPGGDPEPPTPQKPPKAEKPSGEKKTDEKPPKAERKPSSETNAGKRQSGGPACRNAGATPASVGAEAAEAAVVCLINAERADRGLPRLHLARRLRSVARAHSRDMVRRGYFAHDTRGGPGWSARIRGGGYAAGLNRWRVGETLAWGAADAATPRSRVAAWLASPTHRRVLLRSDYRDIGVGVVPKTPVGRPGATFTADFGRIY